MEFGGVTVTINSRAVAIGAAATNNTTSSVTVANGANADDCNGFKIGI